MAVVSGVNTATPALLMVHVDHLHRPVKMTNAAGASVWSAVYQPWGGAHSITGAETLDARFPGQWYQLEAGLHYNWHRHYDPSLGRYTQPDPLGLADGPSIHAYARNTPIKFADKLGLLTAPQSKPPNPTTQRCQQKNQCKEGNYEECVYQRITAWHGGQCHFMYLRLLSVAKEGGRRCIYLLFGCLRSFGYCRMHPINKVPVRTRLR